MLLHFLFLGKKCFISEKLIHSGPENVHLIRSKGKWEALGSHLSHWKIHNMVSLIWQMGEWVVADCTGVKKRIYKIQVCTILCLYFWRKEKGRKAEKKVFRTEQCTKKLLYVARQEWCLLGKSGCWHLILVSVVLHPENKRNERREKEKNRKQKGVWFSICYKGRFFLKE